MTLRRQDAVPLVALCCGAILAACSGSDGVETEAARALPASHAPASKSIRVPRLHPAEVRAATADDHPLRLDVRVAFSGTLPRDTSIAADAVDPACTAGFVDTLVVHPDSSLAGVLVWVEGDTPALIVDDRGEHRPLVQLDGCRLRPRVQVAAPGSMLQLATVDSIRESLVVVPSDATRSPDTVHFSMDGQLIPVPHAAERDGVIGVYALRLAWARAFIAVAKPQVAGVTDSAGHTSFVLDGRGRKTILRAWHPTLGTASATVILPAGASDATATLTFRR